MSASPPPQQLALVLQLIAPFLTPYELCTSRRVNQLCHQTFNSPAAWKDTRLVLSANAVVELQQHKQWHRSIPHLHHLVCPIGHYNDFSLHIDYVDFSVFQHLQTLHADVLHTQLDFTKSLQHLQSLTLGDLGDRDEGTISAEWMQSLPASLTSLHLVLHNEEGLLSVGNNLPSSLKSLTLISKAFIEYELTEHAVIDSPPLPLLAELHLESVPNSITRPLLIRSPKLIKLHLGIAKLDLTMVQALCNTSISTLTLDQFFVAPTTLCDGVLALVAKGVEIHLISPRTIHDTVLSDVIITAFNVAHYLASLRSAIVGLRMSPTVSSAVIPSVAPTAQEMTATPTSLLKELHLDLRGTQYSVAHGLDNYFAVRHPNLQRLRVAIWPDQLLSLAQTCDRIQTCITSLYLDCSNRAHLSDIGTLQHLPTSIAPTELVIQGSHIQLSSVFTYVQQSESITKLSLINWAMLQPHAVPVVTKCTRLQKLVVSDVHTAFEAEARAEHSERVTELMHAAALLPQLKEFSVATASPEQKREFHQRRKLLHLPALN